MVCVNVVFIQIAFIFPVRIESESESESYIALGWVHKESHLMFTLGSDQDQRINFSSLSVNNT